VEGLVQPPAPALAGVCLVRRQIPVHRHLAQEGAYSVPPSLRVHSAWLLVSISFDQGLTLIDLLV
jgi:hypothetical protein